MISFLKKKIYGNNEYNLPYGCWRKTSRNSYIENGILHSELQKKNGSWENVTYQLSSSDIKLKNNDGKFNIIKERIPPNIKRAVWGKYFNNNEEAKCWCCNIEPIKKNNFDCGHIISEKNGGKVNINNLVPICNGCNLGCHTKNLIDYKNKYFEKY